MEFNIKGSELVKYYEDPRVTSVEIPQGVTSIGRRAFSCSGSHALKEIIIPDGVRVISEAAFYGCPNLKYISIPDSVIHIGTSAFYRAFLSDRRHPYFFVLQYHSIEKRDIIRTIKQ